eukprot:13864154-Alexandrium_andersonii.AAC.1
MPPALGGSTSASSPPQRPLAPHARAASRSGWVRRPNARARHPGVWAPGPECAARGAASAG